MDVRPLYIPPPYQDSAESGRLVLRDGSAAVIRIARPDDLPLLQDFFQRLSPESRHRRFFSLSKPSEELLETLCDSTDPGKGLTLVVLRAFDDTPRIIATGSYLAIDQKTAEVALAVEDPLQGKGLGALLLERLALLAAKSGFVRFWAMTHVYNEPMMEIFRKSGFKMQEQKDGETFEVGLSILPNEASVARSEMLDRVFTAASLRPFFCPRSVAVVGASRDPSSIGYKILESLILSHFQGPVYPVNPKAAVVSSIRAYPTVRDLPEPVDLAIIVVPAEAVLEVVDDCAQRGVRALVVISAGFAEVSGEGREMQQELLDKVRQHGMRMIGPNCMGLLNTHPDVQLNASFSPVYPSRGRIAMASQSGALGIAIVALAKEKNLGLSSFVSVGNKADVSGNDLLQYWEEDPETDVILLYLESFGNPRRFARIARRVSRSKPIVAVKSGRTSAGKRAAGSHTAALAASDVAVDALFHQTGVIRAESLEEMFDVANALSARSLPAGRKVAILANGGGPAVLCADACEAGGLVIPELSGAIKARLGEFLPKSASVKNPIDMIASATPEHYGKAAEVLLSSDEIDALIVVYIPVLKADFENVSRAIHEGMTRGRASGGKKKPVLACLMGPVGASQTFSTGTEKIPTYLFPEAAASSLGKIAAYSEWKSKAEGIIPDFDDLELERARSICRKAIKDRGTGWLSAEETREVLSSARLPVLAGGIASNADEAVKLARQAGFPVALKLSSRTIVHKTEIGGVYLNLKDEEAVRLAFQSMKKKMADENLLDAMEGVLVQPMLSGGIELMAGVTEDPFFGPVMAFGLGGIHVEILKDVQFRVTPLTDQDAIEMIQGIKGYPLLKGYRGHQPADIESIQNLLLRLSRLVEEVEEISELDLNPIFALPPGQGCRIVDARISVRPVAGILARPAVEAMAK